VASIASILPLGGTSVGAERRGAAGEDRVSLRQVTERMRQLEHEVDAQRARIAELEAQVTTDPLIGLLNRRGLERQFGAALSAARRHGHEGLVVFIDVDGFKSINDRHGHPAGDLVLYEIARTIAANVRDSDLVARVGGDEFVAVLVNATPEEARSRGYRLKRLLDNLTVDAQGRRIAVRASVGMAAYDGRRTGHAVLAEADAAMYEAERAATALIAPAEQRRGTPAGA